MRYSVSLYMLILLALLSCDKGQRASEIFDLMKEDYEDLTYDANGFYLKDFGISKEKYTIDGLTYKKIVCSEEALFYMAGYVRFENDKVFLLPLDYDGIKKGKENLLFDFKSKLNSMHEICLTSQGNINYCLSIISLGGSKVNRDEVYRFKLIPYSYIVGTKEKSSYGFQHIIDVSKKEGIRKIITMQERLNDTIAVCSLYPFVKLNVKDSGSRPL